MISIERVANYLHRRSQSFLWGCTFLVLNLKTQAKTAKLTTPTLEISSIQQKSQNLDSSSASGCTYNFPPVHLAHNFFLRPGDTVDSEY